MTGGRDPDPRESLVPEPPKKQFPWLDRLDWIVLCALFILAALTRLFLRDGDFFSDEPMSYYISRHFGEVPANVYNVYGGPWFGPLSWFYERPAFYLLMAPASWFSFEAYRIEYILLSATLAPLAAAFLRGRRVRRHVAWGAGLVVALHPQFVVWGAITHMDSTMTVALAAGAIAAERSRHVVSGAFFLVAVWMKEVAIVFVGFLLLITLVPMWQRGDLRADGARLDRHQTALAVVLLLGLLPLWVAQEMGFGLPGEGGHGNAPILFDRLMLTVWLLPLVVAGLFFQRSRPVALWAFAFPLFYMVIHTAFDVGVRDWYYVGPAFFAVVAAALGLDVLLDWAAAIRRLKVRLAGRVLAGTAVTAVAALLASEILLADSPEKDRWLNPVSQVDEPSLNEALRANENRNPEAREALARLAANPVDHLFLIDVHYAVVYYPIPNYARELRSIDTNWILLNESAIQAVAHGLDSYADLTMLQKRQAPLNLAVRAVYADCVVHENPAYVFYDGHACAGRADALRAALEGAARF